LVRFPDWQTRLHRFLLASANVQFEYGVIDCCLFACDAVLAMTGTDPALEFRGKYSSRAEAVKIMRRHTGKKTLRAFVTRTFTAQQIESVPVLFAQRGDLILLKRSADYSLGILALNGQEIVGLAKQGITHFPLAQACLAWRV
jgi:hypothetical protein